MFSMHAMLSNVFLIEGKLIKLFHANEYSFLLKEGSITGNPRKPVDLPNVVIGTDGKVTKHVTASNEQVSLTLKFDPVMYRKAPTRFSSCGVQLTTWTPVSWIIE